VDGLQGTSASRDIREKGGRRKGSGKNLDITNRCKKERGGVRQVRRNAREASVRVQSTWKRTRTIQYDFNYELILFVPTEERRYIGKELLEISSEIEKIKERGRDAPLSS